MEIEPKNTSIIFNMAPSTGLIGGVTEVLVVNGRMVGFKYSSGGGIESTLEFNNGFLANSMNSIIKKILETSKIFDWPLSIRTNQYDQIISIGLGTDNRIISSQKEQIRNEILKFSQISITFNGKVMVRENFADLQRQLTPDELKHLQKVSVNNICQSKMN